MTVKVGIEIPRELHTRVKMEAARRRIKIKDACREAFEGWLKAGDGEPDAEFRRQMGIAREAMTRYHRALKELAR